METPDQQRHAVIADLKRLSNELGHVVRRSEYVDQKKGKFSRPQIDKLFGSYTAAIYAADLMEGQAKIISPRPSFQKKQKFQYVPPKIDPNIMADAVTLDLAEMFRRAGNPETLKMVAQPDTHLEHADEPAVQCFLDFVSWYQPDVYTVMGDFLNAAGLSHWPADDLHPKRIVPEIKKGRALLELITESIASSSTTRIYLEGNHENWIDQFLRSGDNPQMFEGIDEIGYDFSLRGLLGLAKLGFDLFPVNQIVRIGRASFTHGLFEDNNHASKHVAKVKGSIFYGHSHDTKSFTDTGINGPVEAQSLGCLCNLRPKFLKNRLNNWEHSFGVFEFFPDGSYCHVVPKIRNGRLSFAGKVFKG